MLFGVPIMWDFICLWNTRVEGDQCSLRNWSLRGETKLRHDSIAETPLVQIENVLIPPLHIKLDRVTKYIVTNFV